MTVSRREFMKANAAAAAAAAAGISLPVAQAGAASGDKIRWDKAACRFCGTGCGVLVGVQDGRVVATQGDPDAEVNRGLQLRQGLLPVEDHVRRRPPEDAAAAQDERPLRQERRVHAGVVEGGVRHHGREVEGGAEERRPDHRRHVRLRPVDDLGGLRGGKAAQGRLPLEQPRPERPPLHGLGGDRVHAHLRHRRADGLLRRLRARRRLRDVGLEHGGDAPGALDAHHRPAAEPPAREGRRALDLPAPRPRARRPAHDLHAQHRPRDPQLHRPPHHQHRAREQGLRREAPQLRARQRRHRLRAAARGPARAKCEERRRTPKA